MLEERYYTSLGKIAYTYSRIDFWLGHIGQYLGLSNSYIKFFSEQGIVQKVEKIIDKLSSEYEGVEIEKAISIFSELTEATKKRNGLIHGLMLSNEKYMKIHYYKNSRNGIINQSFTITIEELEEFVLDYIKVHNKVYSLMIEIEQRFSSNYN